MKNILMYVIKYYASIENIREKFINMNIEKDNGLSREPQNKDIYDIYNSSKKIKKIDYLFHKIKNVIDQINFEECRIDIFKKYKNLKFKEEIDNLLNKDIPVNRLSLKNFVYMLEDFDIFFDINHKWLLLASDFKFIFQNIKFSEDSIMIKERLKHFAYFEIKYAKILKEKINFRISELHKIFKSKNKNFSHKRKFKVKIHILRRLYDKFFNIFCNFSEGAYLFKSYFPIIYEDWLKLTNEEKLLI
ncbi:hypothetical protein H311_01900, partial [Anncaliia algerae PRA109]